LKEGDWVIYTQGKAVGQVAACDIHDGVFVYVRGYTITRFHKKYLTVVPKEVADIFYAVNNHKEK